MYQSQSLEHLTPKDYQLLSKIKKIPQLLSELSKKYDTSSLAVLLTKTALETSSEDQTALGELLEPLL
jgi:hypothetical protein